MATQPVQPQSEELTAFTADLSNDPWSFTPADAQAAIDSWDEHREPGKELKDAFLQLRDIVRQP